MPIEVNTCKAPEFLRYRLYGEFPSLEEQTRVPRRRAYLIDPSRHAHMIEQFQDLAMRTVTTAAFVDEQEALDRLFHRRAAAATRVR